MKTATTRCISTSPSAERALAGNPDRVEIMADLEQAIADKCQKFLGPHKSIVTAVEIAADRQGDGTDRPGTGRRGAGPDGAAAHGAETVREDPRPRRLYRIPSGGMIAGVCNGLAAYFGLDAALIRIGFVLAASSPKAPPCSGMS